jgi:hypothetical protein
MQDAHFIQPLAPNEESWPMKKHQKRQEQETKAHESD